MNEMPIEPAARPPFSGIGFAPPMGGIATPQLSLLLDPQSSSNDDAVAALLALESRSRDLNLNRAIRNIEGLGRERRVEWEKQKAALFEAARAQQESGFWGSVGKLCGAVGKVVAVVTSVAVAVGTGGAGAPFALAVAGACLSTAALAEGEFQVLQKLGIESEAAAWIELGIGLAGAGCTGGAAFMGGSNSVSQFQKIVTAAAKVAAVGAGATTVAAGIATAEKADTDAESEEHFANAVGAQLAETRLEQMLLRILDDLAESEESYRRTVSKLRGAMDIEDNTLLISIRSN